MNSEIRKLRISVATVAVLALALLPLAGCAKTTSKQLPTRTPLVDTVTPSPSATLALTFTDTPDPTPTSLPTSTPKPNNTPTSVPSTPTPSQTPDECTGLSETGWEVDNSTEGPCAGETIYHKSCGGQCYFNAKDWKARAFSFQIPKNGSVKCPGGTEIQMNPEQDMAWSTCMALLRLFTASEKLAGNPAAQCFLQTEVFPTLLKAEVDPEALLNKPYDQRPGSQCTRMDDTVRLRIVPK